MRAFQSSYGIPVLATANIKHAEFSKYLPKTVTANPLHVSMTHYSIRAPSLYCKHGTVPYTVIAPSMYYKYGTVPCNYGTVQYKISLHVS